MVKFMFMTPFIPTLMKQHLFGSTIINMVDIQKQAGCIDCGVFAIAIAAGVAFGVDIKVQSDKNERPFNKMFQQWSHNFISK